MTQNWQQFIQQYPISTPSAKILVDLSHFGILKVSGPDASKFLQGQLTCDVAALKSGEQSLGAYCNIKGKVDSLFRLWRLDNNYYLRMPAGLLEPTLQELQKYAIFSKVELHDVSEHFTGFGLYHAEIDTHYAHPELAILTIQPQRYEIYAPTNVLETAWRHYAEHANHVDPERWELLDIQARLPELYPQTAGMFFAHDLNLQNLHAVSFTKGCFRGQEIVARMQHRGKLKRSLYKFSIDYNGIKVGDLITAGGAEHETAAGTVVRVSSDVGDKMLGLAVITDSFVGQKLDVRGNHITII